MLYHRPVKSFSHADTAVIQSLDGFSKEAYTNFDPGLSNRLIENPIWIVPESMDKFRKSYSERENHLLVSWDECLL